MKTILNYKGKRFGLDVKKCSGISKFFGLMFKGRNAGNLLFEFDRETSLAIHSLFCPEFLAIWANNNKFVAFEVVKPWKLGVKPAEKFTKLLEIPVNSRNSAVITFIVGKSKHL